MAFAKNTTMCCKLYRFTRNSTFHDHKLSFPRKRCFSDKVTAFKLLPEVEQLFDSGEVKHRKHPGVNKTMPIVLPQTLITAINNLIPKNHLKVLRKDADELVNCLLKRRLPLEKDELEWRLRKIVQSYEDEDRPEVITKEQERQIKSEITIESRRWRPIEYNHNQGLAYVVGRMAANYASIYKVFSQIKATVPTFQPKTFFDFGSGVGSAVWAAYSAWGDRIEEYFCVDASADMNNISQALLAEETALKNIYHRQFLPASETIKYDLVVSAFSMMDLPSIKDRLRVIDVLWRKTTDLLVIIEYGNFAGFHSVQDARDYILQVENQSSTNASLIYSSGAHVLMPCPHDLICPMLENKMKKTCGIFVPYESILPRSQVKKDYISYVVLRKGHKPKDSCSWPRIVMPVLKRAKHVYCHSCCNDGKLKELIFTRSRHGRHGYRCARSSTVGDLLPINMAPTDVTDSKITE